MPALLGRNVYRHVLLMFVVIFCLRMNQFVRLRALQTELTGMQSVQHALASRQKLASQAQKPAQTRQRRAWQPVLESLSRAILHRSG
jgi:pilus assembly protein HofN